MLVITRSLKKNCFVIGDNLIIIKLLTVNGNQVRLGIEAPKQLSVFRTEIFNSIKSAEYNGGSITLPFNTKISNGLWGINPKDEANENLY